MARESKQERAVRSMFDQVSEHLLELKSIIANPSAKEMDVERWAQSMVRSCMGYSATNGYSIRAQETRGRMRPDLIVSKNETPVFVIEVKRLGSDLNKANFRSGKLQLSEYLRDFPSVRFGFLTNGLEWKLFDFSDRAVNGVEVVCIDLRNDEGEIDSSKRGVEDACWELYDIHESCFSDNSWDELYKEASAFSPDSLARAILSADVVKAIAKCIRGEYEYKANTDALFDRLVELLSLGLDDADSSWNETKKLELSKFVKSQKRATTRKRRSAKKEDPAQEPGATAGATVVQSSDVAEPHETLAASASSNSGNSGESAA